MRTALILTVLASLIVIGRAEAEDLKQLRRYHGWGRFSVGAWRKWRVTKESLDANGRVETVTTQETKATLTAVDDQGFTLRYESEIELAGRRFRPAPQNVALGYYLERGDKNPQISALEKAPLTIGDRKIVCRVRQIIVSDEKTKRVIKMFVSDAHAPFVLKQEITTQNGPLLLRTDVDVMALDMPYKVLHERLPVALIRTVQRSATATTVLWEAYCKTVPGGVVMQSLKKRDKMGRVIERQTVEILGYGMPAPTPAKPAKKSSLGRRRKFFRRPRR